MRRPLCALALVLLGFGAEVPRASASASCTYEEAGSPGPAGNQVRVLVGTGGSTRVERDAAGVIRVDGVPCRQDVTGLPGTVTNTDVVVVSSVAAATSTRLIVVRPRSFAPGATDGPHEPEYIEFAGDLRRGRDSVSFPGSGAADNREFSSPEDGERVPVVDNQRFAIAGVESFDAAGGGGADLLTATSDGFSVGQFLFPVGFSGGDGRDFLIGGARHDVLDGGGGRDRLAGHDGRDLLRGGAGDDDLEGSPGRDRLLGGRGNDDIEGGTGASRQFGGAGDDRLWARERRDILIGGTGADDLRGLGAPDFLSGGPGDDVLSGGDGTDRLRPGPGDDVVTDGHGNETIRFGSGNDRTREGFYRLERGRDVFYGGPGHDSLFTQFGYDRLLGGPGADELGPGSGRGVAIGGAGADEVATGNEEDRVLAGSGADGVVAGGGADVVVLGRGNDVADMREPVPMGRPRDVLHCGPGHDTAVVNAGYPPNSARIIPVDRWHGCERVFRTNTSLQQRVGDPYEPFDDTGTLRQDPSPNR